MSVVYILVVDFKWWVTILGMVGGHPRDGEVEGGGAKLCGIVD